MRRSWTMEVARPPSRPAERLALRMPMTSPRSRSTTGPPETPSGTSSSPPSLSSPSLPSSPRMVHRPLMSSMPSSVSRQPKNATSLRVNTLAVRSESHTQAWGTGSRTRTSARSGAGHRPPAGFSSGRAHSTRPRTGRSTPRTVSPTSRRPSSPLPPRSATWAQVSTQFGATKNPLPHGREAGSPPSYPVGAAWMRTVAAAASGARVSKGSTSIDCAPPPSAHVIQPAPAPPAVPPAR